MIGAIAGDIIGSVYEHQRIKIKDFPLFHPRCRFTDDTVLTVAVADAILSGNPISTSFAALGTGIPEPAKVEELLTPDLWEVTRALCGKYGYGRGAGSGG